MPPATEQSEARTLPPAWRVLIAVPPTGLGPQLWAMQAWLDEACGRSGWSATPAGLSGVVNDAIAFYFADRDIARAFIRRFSCGYRAPRGSGL